MNTRTNILEDEAGPCLCVKETARLTENFGMFFFFQEQKRSCATSLENFKHIGSGGVLKLSLLALGFLTNTIHVFRVFFMLTVNAAFERCLCGKTTWTASFQRLSNVWIGSYEEDRWGTTLMGFCHEVYWQQTNDGEVSWIYDLEVGFRGAVSNLEGFLQTLRGT